MVINELESVRLLRFALAAIWTELERENPSLEDCQRIADEALDLTVVYCGSRGVSDEVGLESWLEYLEKKSHDS